jgi:DNA-directed RNA polymerase specialized sigma24 family protein
MVAQGSEVDTFTDFVTAYEPRLRQSLMAACGGELGRDAAGEALEYAWEHWDRVRSMENPVGYLYTVGRNRARRELQRKRPVFDPVDPVRIPDVEPKLPGALAQLSERQRTVVVLIHGYGWTQVEVSDLLGLSRSAVRNHLDRGLSSLRGAIGDVK